jgi:branched-chain amino acid transport system substrate-binding protein
MKKILLMVAVLLVPVLVTQRVSLREFAQLRDLIAGGNSSDVLVGVAWPFEANQDGMRDGLLLAQSEINARGVRGKRIQLLMRDDGLDREEQRAIAIDFARNPRMAAAIGYYDDTFAVRASAILEEAGMLHIVAGANNTFMTTHGFRYLIRSALGDEFIGRSLARLCMGQGYRNFAIIAEDGAFGEDLAYQTGIELDAKNAHVVHRAAYVRGKSDFRDTVFALKDTGADVILLLGMEKECAEFIRVARGMGLKTPIVGSFSDTPLVRAIAGKALEGVMFYEIYDVTLDTPENRSFVEKYRRRFGKDPDAYAAQGYDALRLLAAGIETTGSSNPLDLAYAIRNMDRWEGANGSYKFDAWGEQEDKSIFLKIYRGGNPAVLAVSRPGARSNAAEN